MEKKFGWVKSLICVAVAAAAMFFLLSPARKSAGGPEPMSEAEIKQYGQYIPSIPGETGAEDVTELLLESCVFMRTKDVYGYKWDIYYPDDIYRYIYEAELIYSVKKSEIGVLYVSFLTASDYDVTLMYNPEGFVSMSLEDSKNDMIYYMDGDRSVKYPKGVPPVWERNYKREPPF